jgi:hypothetical protein
VVRRFRRRVQARVDEPSFLKTVEELAERTPQAAGAAAAPAAATPKPAVAAPAAATAPAQRSEPEAKLETPDHDPDVAPSSTQDQFFVKCSEASARL